MTAEEGGVPRSTRAIELTDVTLSPHPTLVNYRALQRIEGHSYSSNAPLAHEAGFQKNVIAIPCLSSKLILMSRLRGFPIPTDKSPEIAQFPYPVTRRR